MRQPYGVARRASVIGAFGALAMTGLMTSPAEAAITSTNTTNDTTNITYVFQYSVAGSYYRAYLDTDMNASSGFATQGIGADYLLENGFLYRYVGPGWAWTYFQLFLDTDQSPSTGYATGGLGAEYMVENGTLYQHTGASSSWTWTSLGAMTYNNTGSSFSVTVPRPSIGETQANETASLFYRLQSSSSSVQLPVYNEVYFGSTGGGSASTTGTIVPLYSYPGAAAWSAIVDAKRAHPAVPVVAVVNPNNGPGTSVDPNSTSGITSLKSVGITVFGYVPTGYAGQAESAIQADDASWKSFYPSVTGIFFDEMDFRAGNEAFYTRQTTYAHGQGLTYTVGNPGTDTLASYVGTVDTILIYEKDGLGTQPTWNQAYSASNFGVIPYDVASFDSAAQSFINNAEADHIGYIYLTNDTMPNPWDTLSTYFSDLLAYLD